MLRALEIKNYHESSIFLVSAEKHPYEQRAWWSTLINTSTYSLYTIIILYLMKHCWFIFTQWLQWAWQTTRVRVGRPTSKAIVTIGRIKYALPGDSQHGLIVTTLKLSLPNNLSMGIASMHFGSGKKLQGYILTELWNTFSTSQSASFDH
jgi:hypothetical protein